MMSERWQRRALRSESWGYSLRSDVLSHTVDAVGTAYTYDDEGQLLSEARTGYATSHSYDGNGNRKTRVVNGSTETYSYDAGDRLIEMAYSGGADGKRGWSGSVVLVEDDSPYAPWVDWADEIVDGMDGTVGYFGLGDNSNGFFERLITELWLDGRFDKAMEKRRRAGHPRPWTPGTNPWDTARAPLPRFRPRDIVR